MQRYILIAFMATIFGCSVIDRVAVKSTARLMNEGSDEILTETSWDRFNMAAPANLKLIEGLWFTDKSNLDLLEILIKGYGAYAFGALETKALDSIILDEESSEKFEAILAYEKAIFYGFKYLENFGISKKQFTDKSFGLKLKDSFENHFKEDNFVALFYFAQALGSSINLQRDNVSKMGLLTQVKEMLSWVCLKDPTLERGSCLLFDAVIEASTPTLLGGSQKLARSKFKKVIKKQPYNLLAKVSYIQYHLIPMLEESDFDAYMEILEKDFSYWKETQVGKTNSMSKTFNKHRDFNLYNAIALERFNTLKEVKKDIF